jgi:hypothetical protein
MSLSAQSVSASVSALLPPTGLTGTLQAGPQANLTWKDNATNETGYNLERAVNGGAFATLTTLGVNATSYTDTTILPGNTYTYRVAATSTIGLSAYTNTVAVIVPVAPAAPTSFTVANGPNGNGSSRSVVLTWTANLANVTGFTIQRATNATFTSGLNTVTVAGNTLTLTQTGLTRNTAYYFRIKANNGSFISSAWLNVTPLPITTNP